MGAVSIIEGDCSTTFGKVTTRPTVKLFVRNPRFYRRCVLGGSLGAADAYRRGEWTTNDLVELIQLFARNRLVLESLGGRMRNIFCGIQRFLHVLKQNTLLGSRRNIAAHYDLSNDFFASFLDDTMTYSGGIFVSPDTNLHDASVEKYDRICRKLRLQPKDEVLEIGTGWGGFAEHAARQYGCHVTSTTISAEQFEYAQKRITNAGLTKRVQLLQQDYRELRGQYDKLISIEMIEAVGDSYLPMYFKQCSKLLRPDGAFVLQAITIPDQRYDRYRKSVDFIQRYIFPGGCLPSLGAISAANGQASDMRLVHLEDFSEHYARTLFLWRERFWKNIDRIRSYGASEEFLRTWDYYFAYCEGGFRERQIGVAQLCFHKPNCTETLSIEPLLS